LVRAIALVQRDQTISAGIIINFLLLFQPAATMRQVRCLSTIGLRQDSAAELVEARASRVSPKQVFDTKGYHPMKRQLIVLSLIVMLAVLAGCSSNSAAPAPAASSDTAAEAAAPEIDLSTLADTIDPQTVAAIKDLDDVFVIDVREQWEYDESHIPGVTLMPMNTIPSRLSEIPTDKTVVLTCRSGNRSGQVFNYLQQQGFTNIHNMQGGIVAWQGAGLPIEQ
jgi:rhodanese-related sulfurtransferase